MQFRVIRVIRVYSSVKIKKAMRGMHGLEKTPRSLRRHYPRQVQGVSSSSLPKGWTLSRRLPRLTFKASIRAAQWEVNPMGGEGVCLHRGLRFVGRASSGISLGENVGRR